ncbi:MAG: NAD(P)H-hydrate dehydratase [Candidatus Limnocylindrales bacterium]
MTAADANVIDEAAAAGLLPERDPRGHKGTFGRVVVMAGSLDYVGAALMAGTAALRAGCGLVTLAVPASLQPIIAGRVPELITRGLPETAPFVIDPPAAVAALLELPHDSLLLGPGLPPSRANARALAGLLRAEGPPAVVDAGALAALADAPGWWTRLGRPVALTPHPGELARLGRSAGEADHERRAAAIAAAAEWGVITVLKGANTIIAAPDGRHLTAEFEVPALGTGGTGDVLAGVVASLVGQGLDPFAAAALGVYLHARAGEDLSGHLGDAGLMATDLLPAIPRVRRHLAAVADRGRRLGFEAPGGGA